MVHLKNATAKMGVVIYIMELPCPRSPFTHRTVVAAVWFDVFADATVTDRAAYGDSTDGQRFSYLLENGLAVFLHKKNNKAKKYYYARASGKLLQLPRAAVSAHC